MAFDDDGVLIVEDHLLLAEAVRAALANVGIAAEVVAPEPAALAGLADRVGPRTVVLLDLRLGPGLDGSELVAPLRAQGAQVLVVTGGADVMSMARALEAGAVDVLDKRLPFGELVGAIAAVRAGRYVPDDARRRSLLATAHRRADEAQEARLVLGRLTPRESEVLDHLLQGRSAEQVAATDHVSVATVRAQIRSLLSKLGVRSQLAAVARAQALRRRLGLSRGRPELPPE